MHSPDIYRYVSRHHCSENLRNLTNVNLFGHHTQHCFHVEVDWWSTVRHSRQKATIGGPPLENVIDNQNY